MAKSNKNPTWFWWQMVFLTIVAGIGYAGIIGFNWDRLVGAATGGPNVYTDKDLIQCEPGTHQEHGHCVSNPTRPAGAAPTAAAKPVAAPPTSQK